MFNQKYRRLKRKYRDHATLALADLYLNVNTRKLFIDNHGWFHNLVINWTWSATKYHEYSFDDIIGYNQVQLNYGVQYTLRFKDGYQYVTFIPSVNIDGDCVANAQNIANKLDHILMNQIGVMDYYG